MLRDADALESESLLEADVCIVGAGVAGITVARELMGRAGRVLLVEGGGLEFTRSVRRLPTVLRRHTRGEQALARGINAGYPYYPLRFTRARALGGSSRAWHGHRGVHVHPLDAIDMEPREGLPHHGWPFDRAHLDPYYERAHEVLGLGPYAYDAAHWEAQGLGHPLPLDPAVVGSVVFQYGRESRFDRFADELERADDVEVVLHGIATRIVDDGAHAQRIECATLGGRRFGVKAKVFVIATGAIEAARLLLLSTVTQPTGIGNGHDLVGRYFMEHPDLTVGLLEPDAALTAEAFRLYEIQDATDGVAVSAMFRLSDEVMRREGLLDAVLRLRGTYPTERSAAVRSAQVVRRAAHHFVPVPGLPRHLLRTLTGVPSIWRHYRAYRSTQAPSVYSVDVMAEQAPSANSRIRLGRRRDRLGMPLTVLDWQLAELDIDSVRRTAEIFADSVREAGLGRVVRTMESSAPPPAIFGNWHHLGTTRMHPEPSRGVVDEDSRVHGMENLFVAGGSVFPTGGYANPALTITALSLRLADHIRGGAPA